MIYVKTESMNDSFTPTEPIAPCGMDCRLCRAHQRKNKPCPGCRVDSAAKPKTRADCKIMNCTRLTESNHRYCFLCEDFPCHWLCQLDTRYKTTYSMSMIDNLREISLSGETAFLLRQNRRWTCEECGSLLSVHSPTCPSCGRPRKDVPAVDNRNGSTLPGMDIGE
jgi:hypothetical protein